jgi:hypothetical protein
VIASIAAVVILAGAAAALALSGRMPDARAIVPLEATPSPTPFLGPAPSGPVSAAPRVAGVEDAGGRAVATSAIVPPAPSPATPTPTPDPNIWRFEGRVVNEAGQPLMEVCVVVGPHGCQPYGPHTDELGRYYVDLPQNPAIEYEIRFEKEGFFTVYYRLQPAGPTEFHVVLRAR